MLLRVNPAVGKKNHPKAPGLHMTAQLKNEARVMNPTQGFGQIGHSVATPELAGNWSVVTRVVLLATAEKAAT